MLGAIVGDIVGSPYEFDRGDKSYDFPLFGPDSHPTDDTLMTLAVGQALLDANGDKQAAPGLLVDSMRRFAADYPQFNGEYGARFRVWLSSADPQPYNSFGNGSAMRVSAAGWLFDTLEETEKWAEVTAAVTHNHPEGIKGAQAAAAMIFLARTDGASDAAKARQKAYIQERFGYDLSRTLDEIRPEYRHFESAQLTVPEAITAYLESRDFEDAIRLVISLGGDADTTAAITGSIAEAAYGIPGDMATTAISMLPDGLVEVLNRFQRQVPVCG
jgi:ADP-ribosylglycohydrolase